MNLVSGYVQMIRQDPSADAPSARGWTSSTRRSSRSRACCDRCSIRRASRCVREPTPLSTIVERVCELAAPRLAAGARQDAIDVPATLPPVDVDVVQFELALLALISNALDAMPGGGHHCDSRGARRASPDVRHRGARHGHGDRRRAARSASSSLGTTTKPAGHGTGLGLGIVRERDPAAWRHHHRAESAGRRRRVRHRTADRRAAGRRPVPDGPEARRTSVHRILIVDDDPRYMPVHGRPAGRARPRARLGARSRTTAIAEIRSEPFDLLVSDINLNAGRSGLDVLRAFKEAHPHNPALLDQRVRQPRDRHRGRARRRVRLHQQAVRHRRGQAHRRRRR